MTDQATATTEATDGKLALKDWCGEVASYAIEKIDSMIAELESLKVTIKGKCELTNQALLSYTNLVDDAMEAAKAIKVATSKLDEAVNGSLLSNLPPVTIPLEAQENYKEFIKENKNRGL